MNYSSPDAWKKRNFTSSVLAVKYLHNWVATARNIESSISHH